jgi:hypothetical protein
MIPRTPVQSTLLRSLGWVQIPYEDDPLNLGILDAHFMTGQLYRFYDVPQAVYQALLDAPSVGAAFNTMIRTAGFPTAKLRELRKAG